MVSNVPAWIWNDQFEIIYKEINQPAEDSISRTLAESREVVEIFRDMTGSLSVILIEVSRGRVGGCRGKEQQKYLQTIKRSRFKYFEQRNS